MADDDDDLAREWALIASAGDPMAAAVLAANDPWDAYNAALDYEPFLDDPDLPHAGALHVAWAELTDLFETGRTEIVVAHSVLRAAARAWLDRPTERSTSWVESWIAHASAATTAQFREDGDFWQDGSK